MTLTATTTKVSYPGPGGTTFPFNFPITDATDLEVYKTDLTTNLVVGSKLILTTDYAVTGVGGASGSVVLTVDLGAYGLLIRCAVAETQTVAVEDTGPFLPSVYGRALDKLTRLVQQTQEQLSRSLHTAISGLTADWTVPEPGGDGYVLGNVGKKFVWLAAASAQLAADLLSTATGMGASLIGYLAPYTGAVARTQAAKNADFVSVLDFGAVPNDTSKAAANTVAIQAALDSDGLDPIYFPAGAWYVTGTGDACLTLVRNRNIYGAGSRQSYIQGVGNSPTTSILKIAVTTAGNNGASEVRNFSMRDLGINNYTGFHALYIDATSPTYNVMLTSVFERLNLYTTESSGGYAYQAVGGFAFNTIRECTLSGSMLLSGVADGNRILNNSIISSTHYGIELDIVFGAYQNRVEGNTMTFGEGAIHVINGSQVIIRNNQMEQGANTSPTHPAYTVKITGGSNNQTTPYRSRDCVVEENNFGGGPLVETLLGLDYASDTKIRNNVFSGVGQLPASQEIYLTANSSYNYIFTDNVSRATSTANDKKDKLIITDSGEGNFGCSHETGVTSSGGYTSITYFKDPCTEEVVLGETSGGATAYNTVICTLPPGFYSDGYRYVVSPDQNIGATSCFTVTTNPTDGTVRVNGTAPSGNGICYGTRFPSARVAHSQAAP